METRLNKDSLKAWVGIIIGILIIIGLWMFAGSKMMTDLTTYVSSELDEMREVVLQLTAISSVSSTALTLMPGDVATPLAENIADISDYLIIVFIGLLAQKYLFTSISMIALKLLIPAGIILHLFPQLSENLGFDRFFNQRILGTIGKRFVLLGAALFLVVPTTLWITNQFEDTYKASLNETISQAEAIQNEVIEKNATAVEEENLEEAPKDFLGIIGNFFSESVDGKLVEVERLISPDDFITYLRQATSQEPVHKKRRSFIWSKQSFNIDRYISPTREYDTLHVLMGNDEGDLKLPHFVKVIKQVF